MQHNFYDEWTATVYDCEDGWHVVIENQYDLEVATSQVQHMCPFETAEEAAEWAHTLAATVRIHDAAWYKRNITNADYDSSLLAYLVGVSE